MDGAQLTAQEPHRRIEPLQAPRKVGHQQVERVAQPQVSLLMQHDRLAVLGQILFRHHDIPVPAERYDRLVGAYEHGTVAQSLPVPPADHVQYAAYRPERP